MSDRINRHRKEERGERSEEREGLVVWGGICGDLSNEPSTRISKAHTSISIRTVVQYSLSHFSSQILNQQPVAEPHVNAISLQLRPLPPGGCADVAEPRLPNHFAIDLTTS